MPNAEARFSNSLRPRKPEGSLGRAAQDGHLDSHTAPELCDRNLSKLGTGRRGGGGTEMGEEGDYIPIAIHCHHQND